MKKRKKEKKGEKILIWIYILIGLERREKGRNKKKVKKSSYLN